MNAVTLSLHSAAGLVWSS